MERIQAMVRVSNKDTVERLIEDRRLNYPDCTWQRYFIRRALDAMKLERDKK